MGFPRQEYWSGLPFPSPGDLPDPGIEPRSPALTGIGRQILYRLSHQGSPAFSLKGYYKILTIVLCATQYIPTAYPFLQCSVYILTPNS